jgi:hypothetical protein
MPNFQNPKAEEKHKEALELYDQAARAKTEVERAELQQRAEDKEREADKIENLGR